MTMQQFEKANEQLTGLVLQHFTDRKCGSLTEATQETREVLFNTISTPQLVDLLTAAVARLSDRLLEREVLKKG